MEKLKT